MAKAKMKEHSHIHDEKRADDEAAVAASVHFSAIAVCGWVEKLFTETHKKAA